MAVQLFLLFSLSVVISLAFMQSNCLFIRNFKNNEHQCLGNNGL